MNRGPGQRAGGLLLLLALAAPAGAAPALTRLSPAVGIEGGGDFTLAVIGREFTPACRIEWNGGLRDTTFVSGTELRTLIRSADRRSPGLIPVRVLEGTLASNTLNFTVSARPRILTLTALQPAAIRAGEAGSQLLVRGSGFSSGSTVRWNGEPLFTNYVSVTTLGGWLERARLATAGAAIITVLEEGRESNPLTLQILSRSSGPQGIPVANEVLPSSATAGRGPLIVRLSGRRFSGGTVGRWNGSDRPTVYRSTDTLEMTLYAGDLRSEGTGQITIFNSGATGGLSGPLSFFIRPAPPRVVDFSGARVFPNPWVQPAHSPHPITFDGLPPGATVRLFTVSGRWVRTLQEADGVASWDLGNDAGERIASGYYLYLITDPQGGRRRGKLAVVR